MSARARLLGYEQVSEAYARHWPSVLHHAADAAGNHAIGEELAMEAFARLLQASREDRWPDQVGPWLHVVVANLATSSHRRAATARRHVTAQTCVTPELERRVADPFAAVLRMDDRRRLATALVRLSPDQRAAVLLAGEGYSGAEIASELGRSQAAARTLICRTRRRLRELLISLETNPAAP